MAGRLEQLDSAKGGINRLRVKGGASQNNLFDALNCYVDASGAINSRPGTVADYTLPAGTKGLCSANGGLVVFSHQVVAGMPAGVICEVLTNPNDAGQLIKTIHFAGPFLGGDTGAYLYVVVEYSNGDVYHFWLRQADAWAASTAHTLGDLVQPTTPNGYLYRAHRLTPAGVVWAADVAREVGDKVEPTEFTGYEHTVTSVIGANPRSGATEPEWAEEDGGITVEDTGLAVPPPPSTGTTTPPTTNPPQDVLDRYGDYRKEQ